MSSPILLTGGTGTLGRLVLPLLREAGHQVRVLSRSSHEPAAGVEYVVGDLLKPEGIEAAIAGTEVVLHLAGGRNAKGDADATQNLVRAAARAGVRHLVAISVIGADKVPLAYFRSKLAVEQAVADSGLPWTTLRVAQVHDLALSLAQGMAKMPVVPAPAAIRWQPVDASEVADRLVQLTLGAPAGRAPDLAGPEVYSLPELVRGYLRARGKHRMMIPVRMPGKAGRAYRAGANLSLEGGTVGKRTWEQFLAEHVQRTTETGTANRVAPSGS